MDTDMKRKSKEVDVELTSFLPAESKQLLFFLSDTYFFFFSGSPRLSLLINNTPLDVL